VAIACDLILDLSGERPLFAAPALRDGYLRVEPSDRLAVQRALFDIVDLVGEFDKPRFVRFNAAICAHSRNGIVGCNRCLEVCPTQAIVPAGDHVAIDPFICAGHGACVSVCPTGAVAFDLPRGNLLFERLRTLLTTYRQCGGTDPVLLMHDARFGEELIAVIARSGDGLPAHVIPFAVHEITQIGLDVLLTALAYGAAQVRIIAAAAQADALAPLHQHQSLIESVMTGLGYPGERLIIDRIADPQAYEKDLYGRRPPAAVARAAGHIVLGGRQDTLEAALRHLSASAPRPVEFIALAAGAPFGRILLDEARCTLCLACVPACPVGALGDHPEMPQLTFTESACVQCGLCRATCPERAISLEPRLAFTDAARAKAVLKSEAPFHCIRCGKPFASPATIARMLEAMAGHALYARDGALDLIKMCADCRVEAQFDDPAAPFQKGQRPVPRTTDDYLREREQTRRGGSEDQSDG
jgi:ferredoxin